MPNTELLRSSTCAARLAILCAIVAGCSGEEPVNIGDGELLVDRTSLSSYRGIWEGYVEGHTL